MLHYQSHDHRLYCVVLYTLLRNGDMKQAMFIDVRLMREIYLSREKSYER